MEIGLLPFDQGSIAAILYPECDVAEKFGVEGLKDTDLVFSVIVYADRSFLTAQYINMEGLGRDARADDGVRKTEFGYLRRCSEPFPDITQEMNLGGM
jgi:hypothetical protein